MTKRGGSRSPELNQRLVFFFRGRAQRCTLPNERRSEKFLRLRVVVGEFVKSDDSRRVSPGEKNSIFFLKFSHVV